MDFNKLWAAIQTEADKIWVSLKPLVAQIKPMVIAAEEEIATLALNAVATQAPLVLTGQVKLQNATSTVINSLAASGKSISSNLAQAAVQTAYNFLSQALHSNQPAAK